MLVRVTVYVGCLSGVINDDDSQMLVENRRFNLPHLYLAALSGVSPLGVTPLKSVDICIQQLGRVEEMAFTVRRSYSGAVLGVIILSICHTRALSLI